MRKPVLYFFLYYWKSHLILLQMLFTNAVDFLKLFLRNVLYLSQVREVTLSHLIRVLYCCHQKLIFFQKNETAKGTRLWPLELAVSKCSLQ